MNLLQIKQRIGQKFNLIVGVLFLLALILYAVAYIIEKGFTGLSIVTITAAVATALLLTAVSVTIEQYIKANLSDQEVKTMLKCREFGVQNLEERNTFRRINIYPPANILDTCHSEVLILAYSAENFIEANQQWIAKALDNNIYIGLLIIHPEHLEQAKQTEKGRNIKPQIDKTLGYCKALTKDSNKRAAHLKAKGYRGHFYFTGIFIDRNIWGLPINNPYQVNGLVRIQLKANYKSQHIGLLPTFNPQSYYATYYEESCREIWKRAEDLFESKK